jgi:O-antigen/teichoic acid export membrane protein
MLPGLMATGFGSVLNTKLAGEGYPPLTIWAAAAALLTNVLLNLAMIPTWGLEGAAISTSVAYILWAAIVTIGFQRRTGVAWRRFLTGH